MQFARNSKAKKTTLDQFFKAVEGSRAKAITDVTILDLARCSPRCNNGLYIFFLPEKPRKRFIYVGRVKSQSFGQRIATHFDLRATTFFGSLLSNVLKEQKKIVSKQAALKWLCRHKAQIQVLTFDSLSDAASAKLEQLLIYRLNTSSANGNGFNRQKGFERNDKLTTKLHAVGKLQKRNLK